MLVQPICVCADVLKIHIFYQMRSGIACFLPVASFWCPESFICLFIGTVHLSCVLVLVQPICVCAEVLKIHIFYQMRSGIACFLPVASFWCPESSELCAGVSSANLCLCCVKNSYILSDEVRHCMLSPCSPFLVS